MAPPPNTPVGKPLILKATYQSPPPSTSQEPETHVFRHPLSTSLSRRSREEGSTARTAYLAELRSSVLSLQSEVNTFLTDKMEEDKRLAAQTNGGVVDTAVEKREEENYGEEVVDDDEDDGDK